MHKFYRKQCSLLESFESDRRQIADFQSFRQQRTKYNSTGDESVNSAPGAVRPLVFEEDGLIEVEVLQGPEDDEEGDCG